MTRHLIGCLLLLVLVTGCSSRSPRSEGNTYQTVGRDLRRNTDAARVHNARGVDAIAKQDYALAESELKKALAEDIMFGPAHNNLGKVYFHQNKLYLAAWEFEYAAKLMPHVVEPKNNIGLVFETAGKWDDAVTRYSEALTLEPDNPEVLANTARVRIRRGDNDPALRDMLSRLALIDTRPEWKEWARHKLILLSPATTQPASLPQ